MDEFTAIWKPIDGFEGLYSVSNEGAIYSHSKGDFKKINQRKDGYMVTTLYKDGKNKNVYLHRLVIEHFSNESPKDTVNHKDGNKANNTINNLEWATYAENNNHAITFGLNSSEHKRNKKGSIKVSQYDKDGNLINTYPSMREAERQTGVTATEIGHGVRKGWKYGGFIWKFA